TIAKGARMKQLFAKAALLLFVVGIPAAAAGQGALAGQWKNPKGSVVVRLAPCGKAICGFVTHASEHAQEVARKNGTLNLIGTRILSGLRPAGDGSYKGQVFDPKRNVRAPATVRQVDEDAIEVRGCAVWGLVCKEQRWTRVG